MFDHSFLSWITRLVIWVVSLCWLLTVSPFAHAGKLGYVDVKKALLLIKDGSDAKERLKQMKERYQQQLNDLQQRLKEKKAYYDLHRGKLKKAEKRKLQGEMQRMLFQLQQAYAGLTKRLMQLEARETERILKKMLPVLEKIRAKYKLDMILDRSSASVLVARKDVDYTRHLVCRYNRKHGGDTSYCNKKSLPKTPEPSSSTDKAEDPLGIGF